MKGFTEQIYRNTRDYKAVVFLDRDGTINREVNYLSSRRQIKILPTVVDGIRLLNKRRIAAVVITNQPVVARGLITVDELKKINDTLFETLQKDRVCLDGIYSCPHHPERNHHDIPLSVMKYRIECECRKPKLAMHKKAISIYGPKVLGVIGDQTRDILAGKNLGTRGAIVRTGHKGEDGLYHVTADFVFDNFLDAVRNLL